VATKIQGISDRKNVCKRKCYRKLGKMCLYVSVYSFSESSVTK